MYLTLKITLEINLSQKKHVLANCFMMAYERGKLMEIKFSVNTFLLYCPYSDW